MQWAIPSKSLGLDLCFNNISSARHVTEDLVQYNYCKQVLPVVKQERDLLQLKDKNNQVIITNVTKQREIYKAQSDQFKQAYQQTSDELAKAKADAPDRKVWFGAGALATVVVFIIGLIAFRK